MEWVITAMYLLPLALLFVYSLGQAQLARTYLLKKRSETYPGLLTSPSFWPRVTVQLPVYNEAYVVERLMDAVDQLAYPRHLLQVQILDDSTDTTSELIRQKLAHMDPQRTVWQHLQRPNREGFKAGALQYGLSFATGEFLAIFDADFTPPLDFLQRTLPCFQSKEVGMVQTRWGHINQNYSLLTRLQAFGLDAHFTIEQVGRSQAGSFINFNGTAGVWRRACIEEAGGWSADTLTEDLDLSYRAQLKGWKFQFLEDVVTPAELPLAMSAIKSQQYRWNKGGAETARKHLYTVWQSGLSLKTRLHAAFHLLNSSVFLLILLASLLSVPMLYVKHLHSEVNFLFHLGSVFLLGFLSIAFFYLVAVHALKPPNPNRYFLSHFPLFLLFSMGLSLHNSLAVAEGWIGRKTPFIRTPKFNIAQGSKGWRHNRYLVKTIPWTTWLEALLVAYFGFGIYYGLQIKDYGLLLFHGMLAMGYFLIVVTSVKSLRHE
jgi:cellulose synthase/poly-beta-1,6-N-acetylglucosamine synthase-like glycosyltransferase